MPNYSIMLALRDSPQFCAITKTPSDFPDELAPVEGERLGDAYNPATEFEMSKVVNPRGLQIADVIPNGLSFLMVSERMKDLLQSQAKREIEFLPFHLRNHKGRMEKATCYIANVLGTIDCGDRAHTEGSPSPVDDTFLTCTRLAIDSAKVPADADIFRASLCPCYILVRDDLRAKIEAAQMSVRFVRPGEEI
jgi:hypothetical protein